MLKNRKLYFLRMVALFPLIHFLNGVSFAQFGLSTSVDYSYDNNINSTSEAVSDRVIETYLGMLYDINSKRDNLRFHYDGSFNYYSKNTGRTFHLHNSGFAYSRMFGKNIGSALNIGSYLEAVFNRADYTYMDTRSITAFANIRHYLGDRVSGMLGGRSSYVDFNEFQELNHFDNNIFASVNGVFPSRITMFLEMNLNIKSYTGHVSQVNGKGKHGITQISTEEGDIFQLSASTRFTGSLSDLTGLRVRADYQKNLNYDDRYLAPGTVTSGNEIFEDTYAFEGPFFEVSLTQRLPFYITVQGSASYEYRKYGNRPALGLDQSVKAGERIDIETVLGFSLEKDFRIFGVRFYYILVDNSSNDEHYNFKNNIFGLGINSGF